MRAVVVVLLMIVGAGEAGAAVGCVVKGTRPLPVRVKTDDGQQFVFFRAEEYRVRIDESPMEVIATEPLRFRGWLGMPLPGMQLATAQTVGAVRLRRGANVRLLERHGGTLSLEAVLDGIFAVALEAGCGDVELGPPRTQRQLSKTNVRPRGKLLHLGVVPADGRAVTLTILDREHADVTLVRRQGKFALISARLADGELAGWVPAHELVREGKAGATTDEPVRNEALADRAAPAQSHPVRVKAEALVYSGPERRSWATVARTMRVCIADTPGPWVEVTSEGEHVWVKRESVVEGWPDDGTHACPRN